MKRIVDFIKDLLGVGIWIGGLILLCIVGFFLRLLDLIDSIGGDDYDN